MPLATVVTEKLRFCEHAAIFAIGVSMQIKFDLCKHILNYMFL